MARIHIHHHFDPSFEEALKGSSSEVIIALLTQLKEQTMADAAKILADVTKNTDALKALSVAADGLNEGQSSIEEEIAVLKEQIAALGTPVDLTPLETAVAEQATVIDGLKNAVVKGTVLEPSANG